MHKVLNVRLKIKLMPILLPLKYHKNHEITHISDDKLIFQLTGRLSELSAENIFLEKVLQILIKESTTL